ncbi:MAG TPA: hypothetical protein DIS79_10535 [Bacteroidetes bacterium]|nr:hypothetical protein [Bacteroidota bacterium]HRK04564.1 DUF1232 domain-containing protein [Chlorobiota bacterium]
MGNYGRSEKDRQLTVDELTQGIAPEDEDEILDLVDRKLAERRRKHPIRTLLSDVGLLTRMVRDRTFSLAWSSRAVILGALLYFVLPTDATPDFLPVIGYLDDTVVLGIVIRRLSAEIDNYRLHLARR